MSINVTVSGNPVSIKNGKMVTTNYDKSKQEFEKRRLMRLEQVRQQSKDIAENIRNKVHKQKSKSSAEIEKVGEVKLKNWQARKLLELQNQYQEVLEDIGLGHKEADKQEKDDEKYVEQQKSNDVVAKERGRVAAERLQIEVNEKNLKKAVPVQRKKMTRDQENTRSNKVSKSHNVKSPFKRKKKLVCEEVTSSDSDSENKIPTLLDLDGETESSSYLNVENQTSSSRKPPPSIRKVSKEQQTCFTVDKEAQTHLSDQPSSPRKPEIRASPRKLDIPRDTRISERIKRRAVLSSEPDYCDFLEKQLSAKTDKENVNVCSKCGCCCCCPSQPVRDELSQLIPQKETTEDRIEQNKTGISKNVPKIAGDKLRSKTPLASKDEKVIPTQPKITLRSRKLSDSAKLDQTADSTSKPQAEYYEHSNRYAKRYFPKQSQIEKINENDLEISPNLTDNELQEKMRQRDIEAHIRGQIALEKEKIEREYRELLKKLPALQKQERLFEIGMDKPKYHMSDERLNEMEKKRQNTLDNVYEELFVRNQPAAVTLPKRKTVESEYPPSLNLAEWDSGLNKQSSETSNRSEQLNNLLENLKAQKEHLMKEIESTLSKTTLDQIVNGTEFPASKRKRGVSSPDSTENEQSTSKVSSSRKKQKGSETASSSDRTSKRKRKKSKRILVLQNMSTQTTPKIAQSVATSPSVVSSTVTCPKIHQPCDCKELEEFCEILIKIKENEEPEVVVNPPVLSKSVKVVTETNGAQVTESLVKDQLEDSKKSAKSDDSKRSKHSLDRRKKSQDSSPEGTQKSEDSGKRKKVPTKDHKTETAKLPKKQTSWGEHFSSSMSTTSTSYVDPPSLGQRSDKPRPFPSDLLKRFSTPPPRTEDKSIDPRLLTYIKKLLKMSHSSIENLAVSTASEVSTPSQSVVETPANNPLNQLRTVFKYFNLNPEEVQKQLTDDLHFNTSQSITVSSSGNTSDGEKTTQFKSCIEIDSSKSDMKNKFSEIAESCTKRISNLSAMIEKVRAEKKKILQTSTQSESEVDGKKPDGGSGSTSSTTLDEFLDIDYSYAERLKKLTTEEIESEKKRFEIEKSTDEELLIRLKNLLETPVGQEASNGKFSPLLNIPKLPKLQTLTTVEEKKKKHPPPSKGLQILNNGAPIKLAPHELSTIVEADSQLSTKLDGASKHKSPNDSDTRSSGSMPDILTAIPETKQTEKNSSDDKSDLEAMEAMLQSIGMEWAIPTLKKTREALALTSSSNESNSRTITSDVTLKEFLSKISSTSTSKSDSENISLAQFDFRRTSTPVDKQKTVMFNSDISSIKDASNKNRSQSDEKFYDLGESTPSMEEKSEPKFHEL